VLGLGRPHKKIETKLIRDIGYLQKLSKQVRKDILIMLHSAGSGHTGGSLSAVELLIALFWGKLRHNPKDPHWSERDRFALSKASKICLKLCPSISITAQPKASHLATRGSICITSFTQPSI